MQSNKHSGAAGDGSIAPFEFVPGPGLSRLRIRFRGFWDESTLALYREALLKRAGEDAGERILRALHLIAPKTN